MIKVGATVRLSNDVNVDYSQLYFDTDYYVKRIDNRGFLDLATVEHKYVSVSRDRGNPYSYNPDNFYVTSPAVAVEIDAEYINDDGGIVAVAYITKDDYVIYEGDQGSVRIPVEHFLQDFKLYVLPRSVTCWVNIVENTLTNVIEISGYTYPTKEDAIKRFIHNEGNHTLRDTIKIEWIEPQT